MSCRLNVGWSFASLFLVRDSLAVMLEGAGLLEDALREYSEVEAAYLEALAAGGDLASDAGRSTFGGDEGRRRTRGLGLE